MSTRKCCPITILLPAEDTATVEVAEPVPDELFPTTAFSDLVGMGIGIGVVVMPALARASGSAEELISLFEPLDRDEGAVVGVDSFGFARSPSFSVFFGGESLSSLGCGAGSGFWTGSTETIT